MIKTIQKLIFFFLILFYVSVNAQQAKHVILISIDGFRPDFYKEENWGTVNLRMMMQQGAYADGVRGVFPTVTYPSHTTMVTGVMPIKHGVFYNTPFEPNGATGKWYWQYDSVKVPSLWTKLKESNLTTAAIWWPVTVGAPITYNIPECWALPKTNHQESLNLLSNLSTPKGLFEEIQEFAIGKQLADDVDENSLQTDENNARMAAYLIKKYKPNFLAVHLPCTDHFEHEQGRDGLKVRQAIAGADRSVKTILESIQKAGIGDSTTVIVLGDHGFVDIHTSFAPNVLLSKAGFIKDAKNDDWKAMFHQSGGSAFLHLKNKKDTSLLKQVRDLLNSLPTSQRKLFRIIERKELDAIGADANAFLALAPIQGITISASQTGNIFKAVSGGTHGYFPDFKEIQTGFIAYGAGIKKGTVIHIMGLEDVAPTIAKLLGIDFTFTDGMIYEGILNTKLQ